MTEESMRLAILRLKRQSQSLTSTDTPSTMTEIQLNTVSVGWMSFPTEPERSSQPMSKTKKETIMEATYSMRA